MAPLILCWLIVGACALAGALTIFWLYLEYLAEIDWIKTDALTQVMWHERIWDPDNEH